MIMDQSIGRGYIMTGRNAYEKKCTAPSAVPHKYLRFGFCCILQLRRNRYGFSVVSER